MTIILGNDHGCLLNKKVGLWCPYQHIQRAPKSYAAPLSYADLSDFYTRDFPLWFSTSNISAPFDWKIPKFGMGNHTNPIAKFFLWSMAEIPTMSENKARESGIFGFPWFQLCLFSLKWWVVRTWTIKLLTDLCQRRATKKNFMKIWCSPAEIWDLEVG